MINYISCFLNILVLKKIIMRLEFNYFNRKSQIRVDQSYRLTGKTYHNKMFDTPPQGVSINDAKNKMRVKLYETGTQRILKIPRASKSSPRITILSSSPSPAGDEETASATDRSLFARYEDLGLGWLLARDAERSKNKPMRKPISSPGRKFSGFKLRASHGSSSFCKKSKRWRGSEEEEEGEEMEREMRVYVLGRHGLLSPKCYHRLDDRPLLSFYSPQGNLFMGQPGPEHVITTRVMLDY